jgi:hypothetical protein
MLWEASSDELSECRDRDSRSQSKLPGCWGNDSPPNKVRYLQTPRKYVNAAFHNPYFADCAFLLALVHLFPASLLHFFPSFCRWLTLSKRHLNVVDTTLNSACLMADQGSDGKSPS